ncbi:MAG: SDR family NAD(P)-dependent oxidoreductase [Candidatus Hydrogenedens sp.]|nr:SDR family NAD(P)-dependent oxidoreductase [Candidatus Hydrogenedens sp.]
MLGVTLKFPKKRAFVTGAASGLGRALCRKLAQDRWVLAMTDVNEERLQEAGEEMTQLGADVYTYVLDVTDREGYKDVIAQFMEVGHGVDLVFNNAGVAGGGVLREWDIENWDWLMGINFMGVVNGCHFFLPILEQQRSGHLVNTASAAALFPIPGMAPYCTAKAGVRVLSEILYNELYEYGVGVTVIMPEFFRTNLHENTRGKDAESAKHLITKAKYSADDVAEYTLKCVAAGDLYVIFPRHVRIMWWILRLNPMMALALLRRWAEQRRLRVEQARARRNA